jgi:hypothetical protein
MKLVLLKFVLAKKEIESVWGAMAGLGRRGLFALTQRAKDDTVDDRKSGALFSYPQKFN